LLADALLDLYGRNRLASSVLLRGIDGFGAKQIMRTDRVLTLSEDLPIVSVAVDGRERIESLLDEVLGLARHGLVTLERAHIVADPNAEPAVEQQLEEATKLTIFLGRQERAQGAPAFVTISELLHRLGFAGVTVLLGVDGTRGGQRERARFFGRNAEVPMMLVAIGGGEQAAAVVPELAKLLNDPVITLERIRICKRDGELLARPHDLPATDADGLALWQKLTIHTSDDMRSGDRPLHRELVRRLREAKVAGVTTIRGVWGFNGARRPGGDRLFQLHRHVPAMTVVVDRPARVMDAFGVIDELTVNAGLVTSEMVPAAAALLPDGKRGGVRLANHSF
jgi:PII-like signaling protein